MWILGVATLPWLQFILGISLFSGDAVIVFIYLVGWAASIMVGYNLTKSDTVLPMMNVLWIAALLSAMIGLFQWLKLEAVLGIYAVQTDLADPAMGNLAQPNQMASLLLMGIVAYAYIYERRIIGTFAFTLGVLFMTIVLVMTHSRAGMLGMFAVCGFLWSKRVFFEIRVGSHHIAAWLAVFAIAQLVWPDIDHFLMLDQGHEPIFSANGRIEIYTQIVDGISQAPWLGYGWNQTATALMAGVVSFPGNSVVLYAHNAMLDVVAWNGVPMGLILIGMGTYWFVTRLVRVKGLAGTYAMACLFPFAVHSMVEFPFAYSYFLIAAGLLMGVVEYSTGDSKSHELRPGLINLAVTSWALIAANVVYEYAQIEEDFRVTRFENYRIGSTEPLYREPKIWMLSQLATMQRAYRFQPVRNMSGQQLDDLRRVSLRFPQGDLVFRYALAQALNGDPIAASKTLAVVRGLHGRYFYLSAIEKWNRNAEIYPELKNVVIP